MGWAYRLPKQRQQLDSGNTYRSHYTPSRSAHTTFSHTAKGHYNRDTGNIYELFIEFSSHSSRADNFNHIYSLLFILFYEI